MASTSDLDQHPRFGRLADYLCGKAVPGQLSGRQHIEPTEIGDLLPWLMLVDVISQPDGTTRYRIRLVGTEVVAIQGSDGTGRLVDDVLNDGNAASIIDGYNQIVCSRRPQYLQGVVATQGRDHVPYRRIAFPLARDGEHVDMLLFVFVRDEK